MAFVFSRRRKPVSLPRFVPRGRWLPFFIDRATGEMVFLCADGSGRFVGPTRDLSKAWFLDSLPNDDQAVRLVYGFDFPGKEVMALGDHERKEVYEFRGYGFRLVEDDIGGFS